MLAMTCVSSSRSEAPHCEAKGNLGKQGASFAAAPPARIGHAGPPPPRLAWVQYVCEESLVLMALILSCRKPRLSWEGATCVERAGLRPAQ